VRLLALILVFVPLVGLPALIVSLLAQLWRLLTWPVRALKWLLGKLKRTQEA
jgi:hypothetical protein